MIFAVLVFVFTNRLNCEVFDINCT